MSSIPRLPRQATNAVRCEIVEALRDPSRRLLDGNTSSRNLLDRWGLTAEGLFADLADGLETTKDRLFLKTKTFPNQLQRYQCVLRYPKECCPQALDIHVTLSPKGEPPSVKVAVHKSDTVHTLPALYPIPSSNENDTDKR